MYFDQSDLTAAIAGALAGALLPMLSQLFSIWKLKKKGRELEPDRRFTGAAAVILSMLANSLGWALMHHIGTPFTAGLSMFIWSLGIMFIIIDMRIRMIPNELLLICLVPGLILQAVTGGLQGILSGILAALVALYIIMMLGNLMGLYKIGAGDAKLAAVIALTLSYPCFAYAIFGLSGSFFLFVGTGMLLKKLTLKSMVPMGPFLIPGFWLGLFMLLK